MGLGYAEGCTHDYVQHGTTTLFAALDIAIGEVFGLCRKRHRHHLVSWLVPPAAPACQAGRMDALTPWLTPALLVAVFTGLRLDVREQGVRLNGRMDALNKRFDDVNKRFDDVNRELADLRERMAKLEGSLEGFLAGRRDRDAA